MERTRPWAGLAAGVLLCALLLLSAGPSKAQDDYPLPAGNPDTWTTGRPEQLVPRTLEPQGPENSLTAPPQRGNLSQERAGAPAGEADEVFTGTKPFGGIGGTGITEWGPRQEH